MKHNVINQSSAIIEAGTHKADITQLTSFSELIKLHFTLSSPSQGSNKLLGYPLKCTYKSIRGYRDWDQI